MASIQSAQGWSMEVQEERKSLLASDKTTVRINVPRRFDASREEGKKFFLNSNSYGVIFSNFRKRPSAFP